MTTFARQAGGLNAPRAEPRAPSLRLVIRWAAIHPATLEPFDLEWAIRETRGALLADAFVIEGPKESPCRRPLDGFAALAVRHTRDARLHMDHFDVDGAAQGDLPALNATLDISAESPVLLFARTGAFAAMGLPGGRYEPIGAAFERADDQLRLDRHTIEQFPRAR